MAIIKVPARSIVGRPKLNIANDNKYNAIGYTLNKTTYDKYVKLWQRELNIIDFSSIKSLVSADYALWSPPFSLDKQPKYFGNNTGGEDLKFYRYMYGQELPNYLKLFIPNNANNYHYFLIKITVPKPDKTLDYSKFAYRYEDDVSYNRPYKIDTSTASVDFDSARTKEFVEGDFTKAIDEKYIYDESVTENEILHTFVNSDFTQMITYDSQDALVKLRITEDNLEFYCSGLAIIGTPSDKNIGGNISSIYTRILSFYYVDLQTKTEKVNEGAKYSLADNELLSTETTVGDKTIYEAIEQSIVSEYSKGKFSVDLSCLYMEYKDTSGNIVYTGTDGQLVKVGDIIEPYYFNSELGDMPVATYPDGSPMAFKVYRAEISTTDAKYITNDISALEVVK